MEDARACVRVPCLGEGEDLHVLQTLAEELLAVPVEFDEAELAVGGERGVDGADERLHRLAHEILTFLHVRIAELARGPSLFLFVLWGVGGRGGKGRSWVLYKER